MFRNFFAALALLACGLPQAALAADHLTFTVGESEDDASLLRVAVARDWSFTMPLEQWTLGGYWELGVARWEGERPDTELYDLGFTPVVTLLRNDSGGLRPFVEAGIGPHLLTEERVGLKRMGGEFQFGSHLGVGVRWEAVELSLRLQHLSNAGIQSPNPGINFWLAGVGFRF